MATMNAIEDAKRHGSWTEAGGDRVGVVDAEQGVGSLDG
jgi:hypothetical protein